jgi:hypothetical protein
MQDTPRKRSKKISAKMVLDHLKGEKKRGFLPSLSTVSRIMTEMDVKGLKARKKRPDWYHSSQEVFAPRR